MSAVEILSVTTSGDHRPDCGCWACVDERPDDTDFEAHDHGYVLEDVEQLECALDHFDEDELTDPGGPE